MAFEPRIRRDVATSDDGNRELLCPDCGGNYLHHTDVRVKTRDQEDGDGTVTVVKPDGSTYLRRLPTAAIEGRRDSLTIGFWCEFCGSEGPPKILQILQHKGVTVMEWIHWPVEKSPA